jgi:hypothetical protein
LKIKHSSGLCITDQKDRKVNKNIWIKWDKSIVAASYSGTTIKVELK